MWAISGYGAGMRGNLSGRSIPSGHVGVGAMGAGGSNVNAVENVKIASSKAARIITKARFDMFMKGL
jgi:hypothetical protein